MPAAGAGPASRPARGDEPRRLTRRKDCAFGGRPATREAKPPRIHFHQSQRGPRPLGRSDPRATWITWGNADSAPAAREHKKQAKRASRISGPWPSVRRAAATRQHLEGDAAVRRRESNAGVRARRPCRPAAELVLQCGSDPSVTAGRRRPAARRCSRERLPVERTGGARVAVPRKLRLREGLPTPHE